MRHSSILMKASWALQLALVTKMNDRVTTAFAFAPSFVGNVNLNKQLQLQSTRRLFSTTSTLNENVSANDNDGDDDDNEKQMMSNQRLPTLFPSLAVSLDKLGFSTPTPIQSASATRALNAENLLLIASTGSGKTLAYLLPALEKVSVQSAEGKRSTVLLVAPTRELAVQLMRDTTSILSNLNDNNANDDDNDGEEMEILLAVRGVDMPSTAQLNAATVLIGTPPELIQVLTQVQGGLEFIAGNVLSSLILDEVDMLMPNAPKRLRTALDGHGAGKKNGPKNRESSRSSNTPQDERRRQEQKRKLNAAQRNGIQISSTQEVVGPTDTILKMVAARYLVGGDRVANIPCQVIAGSATASRRTLDRLNKALYDAATEASSTVDLVWAGNAKSCRPEEEVKVKVDVNDSDSPDDGEGDDAAVAAEVVAHTIRAVTVPQQVKHKYIALDKTTASSPEVVLAAVAKAANILKPQMALIFLCGDFGKPVALVTKRQPTAVKPGIAPSRTSNKQFATKKPSLQNRKLAAAAVSRAKNAPIGFSARQACSKLASFGIDATPLHVALGLELNAKDDKGDDDDSIPPYLVTFEGSARGLHIDNVDTVFVVGRPASAASYLHLAGRVGRASTSKDGSVVIRPGTVVSLCTKGSAIELTKWTKQIGGTDLEELVL